MRAARSLGAVLAGFAVFAGVVWVFTPLVSRAFSMGVLLGTLAYCVTAAVAAGYVAGWLAGTRELPHAAGVGLLMIALSVWLMQRAGAVRPGWYEATIAGCGPVAAFFGAALRRLTKG